MLGNDGLYFFNHLEVLVDLVSSDDLLTWQHEQACNEFDKAIVELPASYSLKGVVYFGFFDDEGDFKLFFITDKKVGDTLFLEGVDKAESDLRTVTIIKDKRPHNVTADQALTAALEGSGYQVGTVTGLPQVRSLNYYYISPREALVKLVETFQCEFRVRYVFNQNKVSHRYIDLSHRFGKSSGKQFVHGQNALEIIQEESGESVITALIGRGKGQELDSGGYGRRIEFTDVVWSKASGKPVDKPAGQNYVVSEEARRLYGLSQDGNLKHRWGVFVDEDIEDPEQLLERTYAELVRLSSPTRVYRSRVLHLGYDARLGDRVAIIHDGIGIAIEARLFKLVRDRLNPNLSTVEIGDYEVLKASQLRSSFEGHLQQLMDERLSPYAQELQRFYERVESEKERRNTEIDEQFRLARLDFDNYKELAETKANALKEEITSQINSDIRPLADEAKRLADGAVADLARQRQELKAVRSSVGTAKAEAIREARNKLNTARQELAGLVDGAKREARELVDGLSVGGVNLIRGSRDLTISTTGEWRNSEFRTSTTGTYETIDLTEFPYAHSSVKAVRISKNGGAKAAFGQVDIKLHQGVYTFSVWIKGQTGQKIGIVLFKTGEPKIIDATQVLEKEGWQRLVFTGEVPSGSEGDFRVIVYLFTDGEIILAMPQLEEGNLPSPYRPNEEDFSHTIEQLDGGYREKFKVIESNDTDRRTFQTEIEKKVDGFRTSISSLNQKFDSEGNLTELSRYKNDRLETDRLISQSLSELVDYKEGESQRSQAYFEASKKETARQLKEERRLITEDYVAKATYEKDAEALTARFERLQVGGRNLLKNGAFKREQQNWTFRGASVSELDNKTVAFIQGEFRQTKYVNQSIKDVIKDDSQEQIYTYHFWLKADDVVLGTTSSFLRAYIDGWYDKSGTSTWFGVDYQNSLVYWQSLSNQGWVKVVGRFRIPIERSSIISCNFYLYGRDFTGNIAITEVMLEKGSIPSDYRDSEEDFRSEFATYKQGVDGQLSTLTKNLGDKVSSTTFNQTADEIKQSVSTLDGQVMKSSNFTIDENGLVLQSGREFNGSTITSLLTVNPDNIKAITDKMIVTPAQRNLVSLAYRERLEFNKRNSAISGIYSADDDDFEFLVSCDVTKVSGRSNLKLYVKLESNDNQVAWRAIPLLGMDTSANQKVAVKGTLLAISPLRKVSRYSFHLYQEDTTSYARYVIENLVVYKKMSASLLVDGSIEARHIKAGSIEAGHIKAGSITAEMIEADTIKAKHLDVDQALINKLTVEDLLARRITASEVFATSVQAVEISATMVKSGILASRNGAMTINLDNAEIDYYQNAQVRFHSANNALVRRKDTHTAFVHFNDVSSDSDGGVGSLYASIGVTSSGDGVNSASSGRFCGARFFRGARGHQHGATIDQAEIYGDDVIIKDDFTLSRGFKFRPTHIDKMIDMNYLVGTVRSLARCWIHLKNVGWNPQHQNFINAVNNEYNNHQRSL